jgi:tryptophanyl-tRNA synthetase
VLSGAQPTADSYHLGNYFGAFKQWVALQDEFEAFYFIPDLHAITVEYDPAQLRERTYIAAAQFLAAGVDPDRSALFVQSQVPEHAQLAWVLGGVTGFGEASRMTQFKDKSARSGSDSSSVGLFTYPILMAADILLYQADRVPVGEDQRQHVELTRNLAQRFNHRFGETFTVPEPYIVKATAKIYDLQDPTAKMSGSNQSHAGVVDLTDSPKQVAKKIKTAMTDSGSVISFDRDEKPGVSNLLSIYSALTDEPIEAIVAQFEGKQYGHLKVALADLVADFVGAFGDRTRELLDDRGELDRILAQGAAQAREVAAATLDLVYERSGFVRGL